MNKLGGIWPQTGPFFTARRTRGAFDDSYNVGAIATGTPVANLGLFQPLILEAPHSITAFYWINGSSVSGNVDVGLYAPDGTKIVSTGSVAGSGTTALQSAAPSGGTFSVGPGLYYTGQSFDNATANISRGLTLSNADLGRAMGIVQQSAAFNLPSNGTFATLTNTAIPQNGIFASPIGRQGALVMPAAITPFHHLSIGSGLAGNAVAALSGATSAAWPAANRALFFPFFLPSPVVFVKGFVMAGATSSAANHFDLGIYGADLTRIVSAGSTAWSGTINSLNVADITDTELGPGLYYMALVCDTGTDTVFRGVPSLSSQQALGCAQQATAFALPSTATFAAVASASIPVFGFTTQTVI